MIKKYINSKPDIRLNPTNKPKSPPNDAETSHLDSCNIVMRCIVILSMQWIFRLTEQITPIIMNASTILNGHQIAKEYMDYTLILGSFVFPKNIITRWENNTKR